MCACCTFFVYSEYVLNAIFSFISQQSVILSASLIKDPVQLLTRVPVLIHIKVKYAMEVSTHKHILFHGQKNKPFLYKMYCYDKECLFDGV